MGSCLFPVLAGLIFLQIHQISECQKLEVTPDPGTTIIFSKKAGSPDCNACKDEDLSTCSPGLKLTEPQPTVVTFNCSQPEDVLTVKINQDIDCSSSVCNNIAVHPGSTRFLKFSRTFNWELKVQSSKMFQLDFPAPGMRQIKPSETCPDKHTYSITAYQRSGPTSIGTFCRNGTITRIQVQYRGRVSLDVPKDTELSPSDFKMTIGSDATGLAEVDVKMPRGEASVDLFTPNYGTGYYTEDKIKWNFDIEPSNNFTVTFPQYTAPECQKKTVSVDYALGDKTSFSKGPTDIQPVNKKGDFSLTLNNCEAKKADKVPGLSLNVKVEVFRGGTPYLCSVDLQKEEGLSLQIENKNPQSFCEMSLDSVPQEKIVVPAGSKADLSFLDCPTQDLQMTATQTIDLTSSSNRGVSGTSLNIPTLDPSLPVPLYQISWILHVPDQSVVDLVSPGSPSKNLHQSVPDRECAERVSLLISEIGRFCSTTYGSIQKIQIRDNVSITLTPTAATDLSLEKGPFLNVATSPELTDDDVIYTISPLPSGLTYLSSPNWPEGMSPSSSSVWVINVPVEYKAELRITNASRPVCESGHAALEVTPRDATGQTQSWREDQSLPNAIVQQQSFSVSLSNCEPQSGRLALVSAVSLQKDSKNILGIILAVVGALLALVLIAVIAVCVVKKKNKPKTSRSSIYMPKGGAPFLPGNATFPKSRTDDEPHVYASIDDPMYGRHLDKTHPAESDSGTWSNGHQVDTYRPFLGPAEPVPPPRDVPEGDRDVFQPFLNPPNTFNLPRPRSPLISQSSLGFEDRRMNANELNTFKNVGDTNPIRLSADTSRLQPQMDSDSDSYPEPEYDEAV